MPQLLMLSISLSSSEPLQSSTWADLANPCQLEEDAKLEATGSTQGLGLGFSIGLNDYWAIIGAPVEGELGEGASYVFVRDDSGSPFDPSDDRWTQVARLIAPDREPFDKFGSAVGISSDWLVVAAELDDDRGSMAGSAYLFRRDDRATPSERGDDRWVYAAEVYGNDTAPGDRFGASVAIGTDWLAIGAPQDDDACPANDRCSSGAVYLFRRDDNGTPSVSSDDSWAQVTKLRPADNAGGDAFGFSVSLEYPYLIAAAPGGDVDGIGDAGTAYVYCLDGAGTPDVHSDDEWRVLDRLHAPDPELNRYFALSVSLGADHVIVGVPYSDIRGASSGAAHVFFRNDEGTPENLFDDSWVHTAMLTASDGEAWDHLGLAVAITGDTALATASQGVSGDDPGAAYVFHLQETTGSGGGILETWVESSKLVPTGSSEADYFGDAATLYGPIGLIGSPVDDREGGHGSGYIFMTDRRCNDLRRFCHFQRCMGEAAGQNGAGCARFDMVRDGRIDGADFRLFLQTFIGP